MIWDLPTSVTVRGKEWPIRSDYRDILRILLAFGDPDLTAADKQYVCLYIFYPDFAEMPKEDYQEAAEKAIEFIDAGDVSRKNPGPKTMDWEQDAPIIFPAINQAAGTDVRALDYLHWHTFVGYFMSIGRSVFSTVLGIRQKRAKQKKLEDWEKDFLKANRGLCELRPKLTQEEIAEKEALDRILGHGDRHG